ncbi:MAG: hypothetical protein ACRC0X_03525 [Brevinema sp.]
MPKGSDRTPNDQRSMSKNSNRHATGNGTNIIRTKDMNAHSINKNPKK